MSKRGRGHRRRQMIAWFPDAEYRSALEEYNRSVLRGAPDQYLHEKIERLRRQKGA